jgi:hypothetical protein
MNHDQARNWQVLSIAWALLLSINTVLWLTGGSPRGTFLAAGCLCLSSSMLTERLGRRRALFGGATVLIAAALVLSAETILR